MKKRSKKPDLAQAHRLLLAMRLYRVLEDEPDIDAIGQAMGLALIVWGNKHGRAPEEMIANWTAAKEREEAKAREEEGNRK
jgi:hypothetical protein